MLSSAACWRGEDAGGGADRGDVTGVELGEPGVQPVLLTVAEHELQQSRQLVQVLAGVVEVDDLGGLGEVPGGEVPDPGRAVTQGGELADVAGAAAAASAAMRIPNSAAGAKVAR